jgi:hypothetical protein
MASFTDLVRAQRQSGKSVVTSLSGAYNQMNMQKYDPRNALFSRGGLMTALFPELKGYQATASSRSSASLMAQQAGSSPTAMSSIARDARISARNSMALPSIARNMAQLVRISGGTPAKYFERAGQREAAYESKYGTSQKGMSGLGKSSAGGGFNLLGMLGGVGSLVGSAGSVIGSILGGVGSLVGGAFRGIFGILGSALGGMGFMGVIIAGALGFILYQLYKNLNFGQLKESFGSIGKGLDEIAQNITKTLDGLTDGEFSKTMKSLREGFLNFSLQVTSIVEATMEMMTNLVVASIRDVVGRLENFYEDIRLSVTGQSRNTKFGPGGLNVSEMALTSGTTIGELEAKREKLLKGEGEYSFFRKFINKDGSWKTDEASQNESVKFRRILDKIDENISYLQSKGSRQRENISNVENAPSLKELIDQKIAEKKATSKASGSPTPGGSVSGANLLDMIGSKEGGKMGYDAANKGNAGDMPQGYPGLSRLTVGQVMELQARKEIMAAGKYQIIPGTLAGLVKDGVVKKEDVFSPVIQDKLAMELINRRLKKAGSDPIKQQYELSKEFAAIANPYTGLSYHEGKAGNKASISTETMQAALQGNRGSQIASAERSKPSPSPGAPADKTSMADSVASLAYKQITALDTMMGGKLMEGSTALADVLRDVTREFMNNPTLVDNSQTINNNSQSASGSSYHIPSAYNSDATNLLVDRVTSNYYGG